MVLILCRLRNRRRHKETPTPVVSTQKQPIIPSVQEHPTQPVISELPTVPQVAQAESSGTLQHEGGNEPNQQHYEADPQPMIIASGSTQVESRRLVQLARSKPKRPFDDFSALQGSSNSTFTDLVVAQGDPPQHQQIEIAPLAKKRKSFLISEAALAREEAELDTEAGS
ncbi:hypothetical protein R1sor_022646 [Riccia sorocarpa]|uniref:Uncharacterized protein n=1 Tax=Riccia sorocarpa TaxID=122646 RepID=A0ABD3GNS3_9MARC